MTRKELATRIKAYEAPMWKQLIFMMIFIGGLTPFAALDKFTPKTNSTLHMLGIAGMFLYIAACVFLLRKLGLHKAKRHKLICHSCQNAIVDIAAKIAVASGRCCNCGAALISDIAASPTAANQSLE